MVKIWKLEIAEIILNNNLSNGVQRLLDARGQRGSWMPSKIFSIRLGKFLTTLFTRSPKFFQFVSYLFLLLIQMFHFFASVVKFHENSLLGCPPVLHHAQVMTFFSSSVVVYLHFFTKTDPLDAPQGGCPGPSHRPHPLCRPLNLSYYMSSRNFTAFTKHDCLVT